MTTRCELYEKPTLYWLRDCERLRNAPDRNHEPRSDRVRTRADQSPTFPAGPATAKFAAPYIVSAELTPELPSNEPDVMTLTCPVSGRSDNRRAGVVMARAIPLPFAVSGALSFSGAADARSVVSFRTLRGRCRIRHAFSVRSSAPSAFSSCPAVLSRNTSRSALGARLAESTLGGGGGGVALAAAVERAGPLEGDLEPGSRGGTHLDQLPTRGREAREVGAHHVRP